MNCVGGHGDEEDIIRKRVSGEIDQQLAREKKDFSKTHRLLLLGKTHLCVHTARMYGTGQLVIRLVVNV